ncbi:MAG: HAD family phosphatase [Solobacterium sp.]|nr:HAD family phosphatase [Solobacterium sp.]MBR2675839.1 HAD family phosphatase [Solobacterium sp.]
MKAGAIFDMDGLMFDTERLYQENWQKIANEMGIVLPGRFAREICGTNGDMLRGIVKKYYHTEDPDGLFQSVVKGVEEMVKKQVPVKPGLFEILEFFRENGVKMAVASSSYPEVIRHNIKTSNTEQFFDAVVSGSLVGRGKPFPDVFLYAAEQLSLDPKDCYVFEDSINGVLAGLEAGCETIMVPDYAEPNETILSSNAHICASLLEALEQIRKGAI